MSEKIEIEKFLGLAKPVIQLERGQLVALHHDYSVVAAEKFMEARFRPHGEFTTPSMSKARLCLIQHSLQQFKAVKPPLFLLIFLSKQIGS